MGKAVQPHGQSRLNKLGCVFSLVRDPLAFLPVARGRIELPTPGFSDLCSAN